VELLNGEASVVLQRGKVWSPFSTGNVLWRSSLVLTRYLESEFEKQFKTERGARGEEGETISEKTPSSCAFPSSSCSSSCSASSCTSSTSSGPSLETQELIQSQRQSSVDLFSPSIRNGFVSRQRVIELGSGLGLVGLVAMSLGAREVVFTDGSANLSLLQRNVEENLKRWPKNSSPSSSPSSPFSSPSSSPLTSPSYPSPSTFRYSPPVSRSLPSELTASLPPPTPSFLPLPPPSTRVRWLLWSDETAISEAELHPLPYEGTYSCYSCSCSSSSCLLPSSLNVPSSTKVVLAADVVYDARFVRPLLKTIHLLSGPETLILLFFEAHDQEAVAQVFELLPEYFIPRYVPIHKLHRAHQEDILKGILHALELEWIPGKEAEVKSRVLSKMAEHGGVGSANFPRPPMRPRG
jgi:predicted nicotinamide N-methyase